MHCYLFQAWHYGVKYETEEDFFNITDKCGEHADALGH